MKKFFTSLLILFLFYFGDRSYGFDSTLNNKRIEKIKALGHWLDSKPNCRSKEFNPDTSRCWKVYDSAVIKFFDRKIVNAKYELKRTIFSLDYLLLKAPIDNFIIKAPNRSLDTLINSVNFDTYFNNTVIVYFQIGQDEFELFYFRFSPNSDNLIYLIEAGGLPQEYLDKKTFLNNL